MGIWVVFCVCLVAQSCLTLCDPMDCNLPDSSVHGDFPGKNTGVGCHALIQGICLAQGSNPGLPHCRWILYHLSHQGSPQMDESIYIFTALFFSFWLYSAACGVSVPRSGTERAPPAVEVQKS